MTEIHQEPIQVHPHLLSNDNIPEDISLKQRKKTKWGVIKIMRGLNKLINSFIQLIRLSTKKQQEEVNQKTKKHHFKIEVKDNQHLVDVGGDFPVAFKKQSDQNEKIKEAQMRYETAEKAFNNIRVFKMKGSIATIKLSSQNMTASLKKLAQEGVLPQSEWEIASKACEDFQKFIADELSVLRNQKDPKTERLNSAEIESHLQDIFNQTNIFHKKIINTVKSSLKEKPQAENFKTAVNAFAREVSKQIAIYKSPSQDDYLNSLFAIKEEAHANLLQLTQSTLIKAG
ncbi:MAG: hypothetical protein ACH350_01510 [Parachlamydiaceae bacterium]